MVSLNLRLRIGFLDESEFQDFNLILTEINKNEIGIEITGIKECMVSRGCLGRQEC